MEDIRKKHNVFALILKYMHDTYACRLEI